MTATNQNIPSEAGDFEPGDTLVVIVSVDDSDGADYPLDGLTSATFTISETPSGAATITKTDADGIVVSDAAAGELTITVPSNETANLDYDRIYYHKTKIDVNGRVATVAKGTLTTG